MSDAFIGVRKEYGLRGLEREMLLDDPVLQLQNWIQDASDARIIEPNAMTLATVGASGRVSSRVVLLRGLDARGLTFFTNYSSRKGQELAAHPGAALNFWWGILERQVRIEGVVEQVSAAESEAYFASRPYESQLASAASEQSAVIPDRDFLEAEREELRSAHPEAIPRPVNWGGYRLVPDYFEFWQGRPARLHDRFAYTRVLQEWKIERLSP